MGDTVSGGGPPPPAPNANPDCPHQPDYSQCRVARSASVVEPVIAWEPIYDGTGRMTNSDPNIHVSTFTCATCSQMWEISQVAGQAALHKKLPDKI
jgi:hypothetical protein